MRLYTEGKKKFGDTPLEESIPSDAVIVSFQSFIKNGRIPATVRKLTKRSDPNES